MTASYPRYQFSNRLAIEIHADRIAMAHAAARAAAAYIRETVTIRDHARIVFGCAPSQNEFLACLIDPSCCGIKIPWEKITVFHMDDYVGLASDHPQSFRRYLSEHLLNRIHVAKFHPLRAEAEDLATVCSEYTHLLTADPIDLICLGIGENGHIAFNDPPVADFDDPASVKVVELDPACRQQQVNDGCFDAIEEVPSHALTLTIPVFRHARRLSVHVPGPRKKTAVATALNDPISPKCPASILRTHTHATLYLDAAAASSQP